MTTAAPKLRFATLPALLFAAGLGMVMYYGAFWYQLPRYSAAEIEQSIEINLALEQQRTPAAAFDGDLDPRRAVIRAELLAEIDRERREPLGYALTGLVLLVMSVVQLLLLRRWATR